MTCPACGAEIEVRVRYHDLRRTLTTLSTEAVKTRPNPGYEGPDLIGCRC